ncbi:unnamed protein product [Pleuronectes platessa]|uniref:Uncharacterized protein n=1 Tax=Pleuronectes platessa TaxID=8262 RepID=A0A9N7TP56_PLEPL|nr:unnamed protein product [Pleuronectes platessa]
MSDGASLDVVLDPTIPEGRGRCSLARPPASQGSPGPSLSGIQAEPLVGRGTEGSGGPQHHSNVTVLFLSCMDECPQAACRVGDIIRSTTYGRALHRHTRAQEINLHGEGNKQPSLSGCG